MNDPTTPATLTAVDTAQHVDAANPWLGLASFTEETRGFFYGREEEVAELCRRVQRKLLTILFGQSGLGKTSILRAGLVPRLRAQGYCPVYVRIDYGREAPEPADQIKQAIAATARRSGEWSQAGVAVAGESLWEFLHHRDDVLRDEAGHTLIPLLIFDQFEEIFTLAQTDDFGRARAARFVADLADLVENRPPKALEARFETDDTAAEQFDFARSDYRVLISLREDYLAPLEGLKGQMPSITQNRLRLAPMTGTQALEAVMKPGGKLVTEEVAAAIVRFVAGGAELANAEVEPSLLSLICRELNDKRRADGRAEISLDLLAGSHATILSEFYERSLADQPAGVRRVIEDELLTESGFRENVAEERLRSLLVAAGAAPESLSTLVNRRLLRIEERLDVRRAELTHDVLCGVVKASRDVRKEREARDATERLLAEQRDRERLTRLALVHARRVAIGCALLAFVAVASAVFGFWSLAKTRVAQRSAQETRAMAESARGEAEKLMAYLLDDFYDQLEPIGRLDVVQGLAEREINYYRQLPESLQTPATALNRARAETRLAQTYRRQGRTADGDTMVADAVATLERLHDAGDSGDAVLWALSLALDARATVHGSLGDKEGAAADALRALELVQPLGEAAAAAPTTRLAYADALEARGYSLLRTERVEDAIPLLVKARDFYRSVDNLSFASTRAATGYFETTGWLVEALGRAGRLEEWRRVADEALPLTAKFIAQHPDDQLALRARALINNNLAFGAWQQMDVVRGTRYTADALQTYAQLIPLDPHNEINRHNSGIARFLSGQFKTLAGNSRAGAAELQRAVDEFASLHWDSFTATNVIGFGGWTANEWAELGARDRADADLSLLRKAAAVLGGTPHEGVIDTELSLVEARLWELYVRRTQGESTTVAGALPELVATLQALKPKTSEERQQVATQESDVFTLQAMAAYDAGDYVFAERAGQAAVSAGERARFIEPIRQRLLDSARRYHVMALARLGQREAALAEIGPVISRAREACRQAPAAALARLFLAEALLAGGLVHGSGAPELAEAAGLVAGLPAELRGTRRAVLTGERIAAARKGSS